MHRYWVIGILVILGSVLALRRLESSAQEPAYAGKSVTQWLEAGYEDCAMALREIGPAAGPCILARLAREDARYGSGRWYRVVWIKLPAVLQAAIPRPGPANFDELRACSTLLEIGPGIVPVLTNHLRDHNPAVRGVCARTLGLLRQRGCHVRVVSAALAAAVHDPNPGVRASAAWALSEPAPPATGL